MADLNTINKRALDSLMGSGVEYRVTAVATGSDGEFGLVFHIGGIDKTLVSINDNKIMKWGNLNTVRYYLTQYGVYVFSVDGKKYQAKNLEAKKADKQIAAASKNMQAVNAAKKYNDYVLKEIDEALDDLKNGAKLIPNEQVKKERAVVRANLLARTGNKATR